MSMTKKEIGDELFNSRRNHKYLPESLIKKIDDIFIISNLEKMKKVIMAYNNHFKAEKPNFHILFFGSGNILPNERITKEMNLIGYSIVRKNEYDNILETYYKTKPELKIFAFDNNPTSLMKKFNSDYWGEKLLLTEPVLNEFNLEKLIKESIINQQKLKK